MSSIFSLSIFLLLFVIVIIYTTMRSNAKLRKQIKSNYGKKPQKSYIESIKSNSEYWYAKKEYSKPKYYIDDTTWNDLEMDKVFKRLNSTYSSVGEEYMYATLHEPKFEMSELKDLEKLFLHMDKNEEQRFKIQYYLSKLGKTNDNGLSQYLFNPYEKKLPNAYIYYILAALPLLSVVLFLVESTLGLLLLLLSVTANIIIYYRQKGKMQLEFVSMQYIASLIWCSGKLAKLNITGIEQYSKSVNKLLSHFSSIGKAAGLFMAKGTGDLAGVYEFFKMAFMIDFLNYNKVIKAICKNREAFHELYCLVGKLDLAAAIASYRKSIDFWTTPTFILCNNQAVTIEFKIKNELIINDVCHPLIDNAVPNSVVVNRSCLVTGSNASGKSTFVKALAINAIFAQTIHTCLAKNFSLRPSLVITSMAVKDDIEAGDSYFIAEIKSLKRVIDSLNEDIPCLCFIDEILKGTNTIERIAASYAILQHLAKHNCLCIAATHDIELTELTSQTYDNFHFREQITDAGIEFDYKIQDGYATTKNAISFLGHMSYDCEIVSSARRIAERFEKTRNWSDD